MRAFGKGNTIFEGGNILKIVKDQYIYAFDSSAEPIEHVSLGEIFAVKTLDCYGGVFKTEQDVRSNFPDLVFNGATGPIYIDGIKKGDTLAIEIMNIDLDKQGVMITQPGGGLLGDHIEEEETRILPIHKDHALLADKVKVPLNKMIGVIGTAPEGEPIGSMSPGNHGGNLDTKEITEGNTLYLPVFHDGALLALGDLHAAMGDGELNGTGIEIGGQVVLRVTKKADLTITTPIVETDTHVMIINSAKVFNEAVRGSMLLAAGFLMEKHNIKFSDAYRLISAVSDIKVSQLVNPKVTVRVALPKEILSL